MREKPGIFSVPNAHVKVFASLEVAETWFEENDPEGVAFEYEVPGVNALGAILKGCAVDNIRDESI